MRRCLLLLVLSLVVEGAYRARRPSALSIDIINSATAANDIDANEDDLNLDDDFANNSICYDTPLASIQYYAPLLEEDATRYDSEEQQEQQPHNVFNVHLDGKDDLNLDDDFANNSICYDTPLASIQYYAPLLEEDATRYDSEEQQEQQPHNVFNVHLDETDYLEYLYADEDQWHLSFLDSNSDNAHLDERERYNRSVSDAMVWS